MTLGFEMCIYIGIKVRGVHSPLSVTQSIVSELGYLESGCAAMLARLVYLNISNRKRGCVGPRIFGWARVTAMRLDGIISNRDR